MENLDIFFNFCLIIAASIVLIIAIRVGKTYLSNSNKQKAKAKRKAETAKRQEALLNIANTQKAHYQK